jgi:DNA-binding NarL/FixJ family response regulator
VEITRTDAAQEEPKALRIALADDHRLTLDGVRRALEEDHDIEVVGEAYSGEDVLPMIRDSAPDLVLLDLRMPKLDGLACLDLIRKNHPHVKVVMFSATTAPEEIEAALRRGASAYILKTVNPLDLAAVVRQSAQETVYCAPPRAQSATPDNHSDLTERELMILEAVARGLSNKAISKELWVTEQTVKFHLSNVYRKLGVPNRTAAVRLAQEHRLIDPSRTKQELAVA